MSMLISPHWYQYDSQKTLHWSRDHQLLAWPRLHRNKHIKGSRYATRGKISPGLLVQNECFSVTQGAISPCLYACKLATHAVRVACARLNRCILMAGTSTRSVPPVAFSIFFCVCIVWALNMFLYITRKTSSIIHQQQQRTQFLCPYHSYQHRSKTEKLGASQRIPYSVLCCMYSSELLKSILWMNGLQLYTQLTWLRNYWCGMFSQFM